MAATHLETRAALIVVDLQKISASFPTAHPCAEVVVNPARLANAFRAKDAPAIPVNVFGAAPGRTEQSRSAASLPPDCSDLLATLNQRSQDRLVSKRTSSALTRTELADDLNSAGVTQLVACGVTTNIGDESTARQAHELGFNGTLPRHAMTDLSAEVHANGLQQIFPRLGTIGTTQGIIAPLSRRA